MESNCKKLLDREDTVAIKIKLSYDDLALHFKKRAFNDYAVVFEGSYKLSKENVSVCYLSPSKKDGKNIMIESEEPVSNKEERSSTEHYVRAMIHEFCLFGNTVSKVIIEKWKLYNSTYNIRREVINDEEKTR